MCPSSHEDPIKAAIERSRQRREEALRRDSTAGGKNKPDGDIERPVPEVPEGRRRGGGPELVEMPRRKKGSGPQLVREAERRKTGAPALVEMPKRKRGIGAELVEMPHMKKGAAPALVPEPPRRKDGGPEFVETPEHGRRDDPAIVELPHRIEDIADPDGVSTPPDSPEARARAAVVALSKQLANSIGRQGGDWELERAGPLSITLTSGARRLSVHFRALEASFDVIEISETRSVRRRHRTSGILAFLMRLFGGKATSVHPERIERRMLGRVSGPDCRAFEWDVDGPPLDTVSVTVTANYEDRLRHQTLDIRLGTSGPADLPTGLPAGAPTGGDAAVLTRGGAVRAVNAVFAGLQVILAS